MVLGSYLTKPSVGTWIMTVPKYMQVKIDKKTAEIPASTTAADIAVAVQSGPSKTYVMAPSVGTWLAKPREVQVQKEEVKSWKFRPSVGSWLMAPVVDEPGEDQVHEEEVTANPAS